MRPRTDRQTDRQTHRQTRVTTIHFASSTTRAKCNHSAARRRAVSGVVSEPSRQVPQAGEAAGQVAVAGQCRPAGVVQRNDARPLSELSVGAARQTVLSVRRTPVDAVLPADHLQLLAGPVHGDGRPRAGRDLPRLGRGRAGRRRLRHRGHRDERTRTDGGGQRDDRRRAHGSDGRTSTDRHGHGLQPQPGQWHVALKTVN